LSGFETYRENFDNSVEFLKRAYAIDTNDINLLNEFGFVYLFSGQYDKALPYYKKWYERLKAAGRYDINDMHRIGYAYWQNGLKKEADYYFNEQIKYGNRLIELGRAGSNLYYDMAGVYAFRGEKDKAYEHLRIFNQKQRMPFFMYWLIKNDPLFNGIRDEPEFQQIAGDVEAKYQAEHDRLGKWLKEQGLL
jgi:tetratricopeptide (TPR) repeat protein